MDLRGARVVVTGASTGIGRSVALELARRGSRLVLASRRCDRLDATVDQVRATGAEVVALPTDIAVLDDVEGLADAAWKQFGGVDVALFNAGIASGGDQLLDPNLEAWRRSVVTVGSSPRPPGLSEILSGR